MWDWRYWDIAIALVGFFVQCALAYMGLTLTHWKHKTAFVGLVVVGAVFTAIAVNRGVKSAEKVEAQLNVIQQNTEKLIVQVPHSVLTFDTPNFGGRPTSLVKDLVVPFVPFQKDERPGVNIVYGNRGDYTISDPKLQALIVVVPLAEANEPLKFHEQEVEKQPANGAGIMVPHEPIVTYQTIHGTKLSKQDAADLNEGKKALCAVAWVKWKDSTGGYRTDYAYCLMHQYTGDFAWHVGTETNRETTLYLERR